VPILIVEFGMIPGLWWDCMLMQRASKAYDTKVFEIADIDDTPTAGCSPEANGQPQGPFFDNRDPVLHAKRIGDPSRGT